MEFPAKHFQHLVGKRIVSVANPDDADEGLVLTFDDGSVLNIGFSGCEGTITIVEGGK